MSNKIIPLHEETEMLRDTAICIDQDALASKYDSPEPTNGYILAIVTEKPSEYKLKSGLIVPTDMGNPGADRNYLVVDKISKEAHELFPNLKKEDLVELAESPRVSMFYGPNLEQYALINSKYIAAIYSKKA